MSEITKKEFASALKWTWVIIVATIAFYNFAPNYYFFKNGGNFYRVDKVRGSIDELSDTEWLRFPESERP
jgi:hypothetical protein